MPYHPLKVLVSLTILTLVIFFIATSSSQEVATASVRIGNNPPTMGDVTIYDDDGGSAGDFTPGAYTDYTVICVATASDDNGYVDIVDVTGILYHSNKSSNENVDNTDKHYSNSSCAMYDGEDTSVSANCTFYLAYWADDGAVVGTDNWVCNMTAWDTRGGDGSNNASLKIQIVRGFSVTSEINFTTLALGATSTEDSNVSISNLGNDGIDIQVNSSNMSCDITGKIPVGNIHYNTSSGGDYADMCPLTTDQHETCPELNETFDLSDCSDPCAEGYTKRNTYWKIRIPSQNVDGLCMSTITFTTKDSGED